MRSKEMLVRKRTKNRIERLNVKKDRRPIGNSSLFNVTIKRRIHFLSQYRIKMVHPVDYIKGDKITLAYK